MEYDGEFFTQEFFEVNGNLQENGGKKLKMSH